MNRVVNGGGWVFKQALLVLARLRRNETYRQASIGFGVSETTFWRYMDEPWRPWQRGAGPA
ncbi:helix-turn-helix domain-containing protein [Streptomyces chartreusis]|uniref:helix-turn-helix domain-containing protein n=1 Tax=Streptomyces chartreusis TaxID=1969 RepID=UPI0037F338DE